MPIEALGTSSGGVDLDPLRPSPFTSALSTEFTGTTLSGGLVAATPARASVADGALVLTNSTNGFFDNHVFAPVRSSDTRTTVRVPPGANNPNGIGLVARRQGMGATAACYVVNANYGGALTLYSVNASGGPTQLAAAPLGTFAPGDGFEVVLETVGVAPTLLLASVQALDGTIVASLTTSDNTTSLQATTGGCGVANWSTVASRFDALQIEARSAPAVRGGIRIGFLGDSISAGVNTSGGAATLPNQTTAKLAARTVYPVSSTIQAVSGTTVGNWLDSTGGANLVAAKSAFFAAGVNVVSIMLGTNDSKNSVATSTSTYLTRISQLAQEMLGISGVQAVILQGLPLHLSNGTDFNHKSHRRLLGYIDGLPTLGTGSNGRGVIPGDFGWYGYLAANSALVSDGVHPNTAACAVGGEYHANAIVRALGLLG